MAERDRRAAAKEALPLKEQLIIQTFEALSLAAGVATDGARGRAA